MSSCAASYCTCFPKASSASGTSAFWPIAAALLPCRSVFSYSLADQGRRRVKTLQLPMMRKIFGAVPSAVAPWWSLHDSLPPKSSSVLHLSRSPLPHDTTIDITSVLGVSALSVLLRLLAHEILSSPSSQLSSISKLASHTTTPLPMSSVAPCRTSSTHLHPTPPPH